MEIFRFLIFIILVLFPFGQLTKIPLGIPGVSVYLQDLIVSLLFVLWIIYHFLKKKPFLKPFLMLPILVFIVAALLSLSINFWRLDLYKLFVSFLYLARWSIYAGVYFVVYEISSNYVIKRLRYKLLELLSIVGIITGLFGLLQYFLYPNLRNLSYLGWDPHQYRVFGTFFDPGFLGIILVLTLILLLCFKTGGQTLRIGGGLLVSLALALTYSRSSYLALFLVLIVHAWVKKSIKFLLIPLFLLVFTFILLPRPAGEGVKLERYSTVQARIDNWRQTLKIIRDQPIFGVGFNSLRFIKKDYGFLEKDWQSAHSGAGADSSLLFVWATTGCLGLGVYLWMWWRVIQNSKLQLKNKKFKEKAEDFYSCILVSTVALFVHSLFLNSLFYPWVMIWMWILLGVAHGGIGEKSDR